MSVKKQVTLQKGVAGEFICRINAVTVRNKPAEIASAITQYAWYADEDEKTANRPLQENSVDLPVAGFVATENAIERAYVELKAEGKMLHGGTDC